MKNNCPIFISSSDEYSDLWPIFFSLFKKYWPTFNNTIYLNTEDKNFHFEGLDIICTQVGKLGNFGETFRAGLNKTDSPYVLLIMIDYLIMKEVDHILCSKYYNYFLQNNLDSLCLTSNPYTKVKELECKELSLVIPPSKDMFSYQIAFWKKDILYKMALPHESPWLSEWYGTKRANKMKLELVYVNESNVIYYLAEGALHKGKWVKTMVNFLESIGYSVDYSKRGLFTDNKATWFQRGKGRIQTFIPRLLSNLDLIFN